MRRTIRSSLLALLLAGCSVGMHSGNLPPNIHTASVALFGNDTSDPTLGQEVSLAVRGDVLRRLGLRTVADPVADILVTGTVRSFNPELPAIGVRTGTGQTQVQVTTRQLQIVVDITMTDRVTQKALLPTSSISVTGEYTPGQEAEGRKKALERLVTEIVNKARSNW